MKDFKNKKIILFNLIFVFIFSIFIIPSKTLFAQTKNEVLILWNTNSFSPSNYLGKNLPINGSTVYLFVVAKEGDKILDLSNFPIIWYIDGDFYNGAVGKISNEFKVRKVGNNYHSVTVEIRTPQKIFRKTITIPVIQPKVVLDIPSYNNILYNKKTLVSAIPYFFNTNSIDNLDFVWNVFVDNKKYETEGSNTLLLDTQNMSTTTLIKVFVLTKNKKNSIETAKGYYEATYVQ